MVIGRSKSFATMPPSGRTRFSNMTRVRLSGVLLVALGATGVGFGLHLYAQRGAFEVVWERYLEIGVDRSIVRSQAGGYALLAHGSLVRIGESGSELWRKPATGWALLETRDRGFIVAGAAHSQPQGRREGVEQERLPHPTAIAKYASSGDLLWTKRFPEIVAGEAAMFLRGSATQDGFVLVGYRAKVAERDAQGYVKRWDPAGSWVAAFDNDGELRWETLLTLEGQLGSPLEHVPTAPIEAIDGSILFSIATSDLARGRQAFAWGVNLFKISDAGRRITRQLIEQCAVPSLLPLDTGLLLVCQARSTTGAFLHTIRAIEFDKNLGRVSERQIEYAGALKKAIASEELIFLVGTANRDAPLRPKWGPWIVRLDPSLRPISEVRLVSSATTSKAVDATNGPGGDVVVLWYGARLAEKTVDGYQMPVWLDAVVKLRVEE